jgi:hypothetical protein
MVEKTDILDIGIDFSPSVFGNIAVAFLCPKCGSLFETHIEYECEGFLDLLTVMTSDRPEQLIDKQEILKSGKNRLLQQIITNED